MLDKGGSRMFFRRGCTRLLLYFSTNKPHSFFFLQNTSCIRKPQVISGRGGVHPLHPPLRSAPAWMVFHTNPCKFWNFQTVIKSFPYTFKGSNCLLWIKRRFEPSNAYGNISRQFENLKFSRICMENLAVGFRYERLPTVYVTSQIWSQVNFDYFNLQSVTKLLRHCT